MIQREVDPLTGARRDNVLVSEAGVSHRTRFDGAGRQRDGDAQSRAPLQLTLAQRPRATLDRLT
jgi:hypothetical protein